MNKKMKRIVTFLLFVVTTIGITMNPQKNEAATRSFPAATMEVTFFDYKGDELSTTMNLEANYVTASGYEASGITSIDSITPLSITKTVGKNHFLVNVPAFSETVNGTRTKLAFISGVKINTPLRYIKSITFIPPASSYPTPMPRNTVSSDWYMDSGFGGTQQNVYDVLDFTMNPDYTWNIVNQAAYSIPFFYKGNGHATVFSSRWMGNLANPVNQDVYRRLGLDGDSLSIFVLYNQVKELFEDETGGTIPAPTGYVNGHAVDVIDQPFNYKMAKDSALPKTYTNSGYIYTYKGWYKGAGNQGSMVTTHPPSIGFNATLTEPQNEVHIVYSKRAIRTLAEEYVDTNGTIIDSSWGASQSMADGSTFSGAPSSTSKHDSSGAHWQYRGWKLSTEPMSAMRSSFTPVSVLIDANKTVQYVYRKQQHTITEKWVDQTDGSTLVPMTGNPKTSITEDNDPFNGSPTTTITDTGGGIWDYVGWENITDAPGTVVPAGSPLAISNVKGSKEIRYHYKARNTTATLDLKPTPQVVLSGGNVAWSSRLTNTGTSTLNSLKLKATSNWATGLSHPTQVTVTPAGGAPVDFMLSPGDWTSGFNLAGINIPNSGPNNYADITFTDTATGAVNQVLPAEIELTGNIATPLKADNFVRIDDPDEPNLEPVGNAGLINIPDFRFGEVEVKPFAQTKGLDASLYESGYHPYIRFMDNESTGGWSLSARLGQFTSGTKTLPTTTTLKLRNGVLMDVQNYNKHNESLSYVDLTGSINIPSDSSTVALTNNTNRGVYHLEYDIANVELELMAHSGIAGLYYEADMEWTLTTAP